ncbi:MAG: TlpA family protein disulfide reductase [Microbacteriaceae bacterium]|nr:TlpA family protein disulfide reductase [Microbacteriaceae bacterium]
MPARAARIAAPATALVLLLLAGCTSGGGVSTDYNGSGDGDYTSGDGTTQFWAPENRGDPIAFEGVTETGDRVSSEDFLGAPLLVNFWYAACGPCRTEADDLNGLYDEYSGQGVAFLGVNIRDDAANARSFEKEHDVPYASILDVQDAAVTLAFARPAPPSTTPTTFLLDAEGRVAARFTSAIDPRVAVVAAMIDDVLAE